MSMPTRRSVLSGLTLALATCAAVTVPTAARAAAPDRTPPTAPANLHVQAVSHTWLTVAWNPSTDNSGTVMYDTTLAASTPQQARAFGTSQGFGGLAAGTTYTASVRAVDRAGNRSAAVSIQVTTPARTLPSPTTPTNLRAVHTNGTLSRIAWDPSTHGTPVSYLLYSGDTVLSAGSATGVSLFDLVFIECAVDPGSTHTLTVQALSADNDFSAHSAPLTVTIPRTVPRS